MKEIPEIIYSITDDVKFSHVPKRIEKLILQFVKMVKIISIGLHLKFPAEADGGEFTGKWETIFK